MKKNLLLTLLSLLFAMYVAAQQDITVTNTNNIQAEVIAIYKYNGNGLQYVWNVTAGGQVDYQHPSDLNYVLVEFVIKGDVPPLSGTYTYGLDNSQTFENSIYGTCYGYYDAGTQVLEIDY